MNTSSIAPCGLNCELCHGYQREKNKCGGCNSANVKPGYCTTCIIKYCPEKGGNDMLLCSSSCAKFPCKRLKDLDKRYRTKYGESAIENIALIAEIGLDAFVVHDAVKWKCPQCGSLLCVHRECCLKCGAVNEKFPLEAHIRTSHKSPGI
jgi:hypothetical protein